MSEVTQVLSVDPREFHAGLVKSLAAGKGARVSVGAIECEARAARKAGDIEGAEEIEAWLDCVYTAEAESCEAFQGDAVIPGISVDTAKYFLGRNRAVSKLMGVNGTDEFYAVAHQQYWKSSVAFKELVLTLAIAEDPGPGLIPESVEDAQAVIGCSMSLAWPGYVAALKRYVASYESTGHSSALWHGVVKAHAASTDEFEATAEDRAWVADGIRQVLSEVIDAAKCYNPDVFMTGNDGKDFCAAYAVGVLHMVDVVSVEAV